MKTINRAAGWTLLALWLTACADPWSLTLFRTAKGWGYAIAYKNQPVIYQPTVPARPGQQGFATEAFARRVGTLALQKIRRRQFPPTITPTELDSLERLTP